MSHSRQVLSIKYPKRTGPGILPISLMMTLWRPMAMDLSCSLTLLRVAMVEGIVIQNVRKIRMKQMTRKG